MKYREFQYVHTSVIARLQARAHSELLYAIAERFIS